MIYLLETELQDSKSLYTSLRCVFGIGNSNSIIICKKLGFSKNFKVSELTEEHKFNIIKLIEGSKFLINSDLKLFLNNKQKKIVNIKSYKGLRKLKGFPVRGQRTKSNAKTAKKINIKLNF
jgi:small subunit ribosomal protein S13